MPMTAKVSLFRVGKIMKSVSFAIKFGKYPLCNLRVSLRQTFLLGDNRITTMTFEIVSFHQSRRLERSSTVRMNIVCGESYNLARGVKDHWSTS